MSTPALYIKSDGSINLFLSHLKSIPEVNVRPGINGIMEGYVAIQNDRATIFLSYDQARAIQTKLNNQDF